MATDGPTQPTNIILFCTDDHGAWALGSYGNREVKSPALDALAAGGARFDHAYTPVPVCSPARACLITGKTPSQVGIHDWLQEKNERVTGRDWMKDQVSLFQTFQQANYHTGLFGKIHLGWSEVVPPGVDDYFGARRTQNLHNGGCAFLDNGVEVTPDVNRSEAITNRTIQFLEDHDRERPFFAYVGYQATHSPYEKQAHDPAITALYEDATFIDIPPYTAHEWVKNEGTPNDPTNEELRDRYIGYYAAVTEIDNNVKRIVEYLDANGLRENTLIIYTSDHGCAIGHHGFFGKGNSTRPLNMYDISLHVPLIWNGPGIEAGTTVSQYVDHYDSYVAIRSAMGLAPGSDDHPGADYTPFTGGETVSWDDTQFGEYGDLRMIRTPELKLVWRYPDGPHDLFDLTNDPGEQTNIYDDPAYEARRDALKAQMDAFYAQYSTPEHDGFAVKSQPWHNPAEAWRDGLREGRGLQDY